MKATATATATLHLRSIRRKYSAQQRSSSFHPSSAQTTLLLQLNPPSRLPSATPCSVTHTHTHIHMTPMAHQKVAGPARPFKWPSGLEEIGGSRQEVGGRGVAMHWRPEIAYATSSAAVARLLRLPPVLVMAGEVKDGPRSSLLQSTPVHSGPVESDAKTRKHNMIPPSLHTSPPLPLSCMYYRKYMQNVALVCVDESAALGGLRSILRRLLRLRRRRRA